MGKKRHSKDRMFITAAEHKYEWGGKKDLQKTPMAKLPFNCCSISLLPFEDPVCTKEGVVFDIVNVIPFIKKYKRNPVTWQPLKSSELIKLNFHRNDKGECWDPVACKVFTDHTHIVAIATSGNVYAYETIEQLNKKPKYWKDLVSDEDFTIKDIIVIQDPRNLHNRTVGDFGYIKNDIDITKLREEMDKDSNKQNIDQNTTGRKILQELEDKYKKEEEEKIKEPEPQKKVKKDPNEPIKESDEYAPDKFVQEILNSDKGRHARFTSGAVSGSFTSTAFSVSNDNSTRRMTEDEVRWLYYYEVKQRQMKSHVQILTNYGGINVMLHCDWAPKTCENFIELCERKYYHGTIFHRLVRNFCLQGGDPTGTGKGGTSVFGSPFKDEFNPKLSHSKVGILSMANSGPNTNNSQFFFTLKPQVYLDNKHTVFGEVVSGLAVLEEANKMSVDANERPTGKIEILDTVVFNNPFRTAIKGLKEKEKKELEKAEGEKDSGKRWLAAK